MKPISKLKADLMLVFAALCWGLSFVFSDMCLDWLSPFMLNCYRFCISFLLLCFFFRTEIGNVSKETLRRSIVCALPLIGTYICSTYGVLYTTVSNAGFLSGLSSVFTPLIVFVLFRKKPDKTLYAAAALCLAGMALLTLDEGFSVNTENLAGDLISIGCGFFAAANIVAIDVSLQHKAVDPLHLGIFQLGFVGLFNLLMTALLGDFALPPDLKITGAVAFLTVFSTGIAFVLQTVAQKHTDASHAGILLSLEPVFSAIGAVLITGEVLGVRNYCGAVLMLVSIVVLEV